MNIRNIGESTNKLGIRQPEAEQKQKIRQAGEARSLSELKAGDMFRATIVNKTPESLSIRLAAGGIIEAKTLRNPDALIGDTVVFQVVESAKGKILLEMVGAGGDGSGSGTALSSGVVRGALLAADMPVTEENMNLVHNLAGKGMPITPQALQTAAFFMYADPEFKPSFEQVMFLLKEGFPAEHNTVQMFRALTERTVTLNNSIGELLDNVMKLPVGKVRSALTEILSRGIDTPSHDNVQEDDGQEPVPARKADEPSPAIIKTRLYADIEKAGLKELGSFYRELRRIMTELSNVIREHGGTSPEEENILRGADTIRRSLGFMNNINQTKNYLQIPFFANQAHQANQAELHIFKNKQSINRRRRQGGGNTALLALDFAVLGHVEVFITRNEKRVQLQFRAENNRMLNILGSETHRLNNALSQAGYHVQGLSFKRLSEPAQMHETPADEPSGTGITKYSLDMRV